MNLLINHYLNIDRHLARVTVAERPPAPAEHSQAIAAIVPSLWTGGQGDRGTGRQGDRETGRQGDRETGRQGDRETGRQGDRETGGQGDRRWGS
ncbi:MAG: hypothetical protein M1420_03715 [Actinobacteria bacterium]|nr:hypothetical protein [Actinomycetota bacterium]